MKLKFVSVRIAAPPKLIDQNSKEEFLHCLTPRFRAIYSGRNHRISVLGQNTRRRIVYRSSKAYVPQRLEGGDQDDGEGD